MKKLNALSIIIFLAIIVSSCGGSGSEKKVRVIKEKTSYAQGEKRAIDILVAYDARDLETLKSYSSGMFKNVMDDTFFDGTGMDAYLDAISDWDGEIKEVRYNMQEVTFEKTYYAKAYFADDAKNEGKIFVVTLASKDKEKWTMASNGLTRLTKEKFANLSTTIPEKE